MKKDEKKLEDVKLKSLFGLRPGVVIILFFVLSILLLFFLLCVLPGLCSKTSYVSFTPTPLSSIGVYEDDIYLGNASTSFYRTKSGTHLYTFYYEGEKIAEKEEKISSSVFFTLFHKNIQNIIPEYEYSAKVKEKAKENFISSISDYSRVTEFSDRYFFPNLYSSFASDSIVLNIDITKEWLYGALLVSSDELYKDYLKGKEILSKSNINYSSKELNEVESLMSSLFGESNYEDTPITFKNREIIPSKNGDYFTYEGGSVKMGNVTPLTYPEIKEKEIVVDYDKFSISGVLVSESDYALFVEENPMWKKENKSSLIEKGLVDEYYLEGINLNTFVKTKKPIRNISYYAASSYAEWLSKKEGCKYYIPSEKEWYVASLSCKDKSFVTSLLFVDKDTSSPSAMLGSLWEFTSTEYLPLSRINGYYDAFTSLSEELNPSGDIIIKGGSYLSNKEKITNKTVGVMKKSSCSEYCGLRLCKNE